MTQTELDSIWYYFLSLEDDLSATSRFIEPSGQENTFSFEFLKLILLSCTEAESVFKKICMEIAGKEGGNIGEYKEVIVGAFPKIVDAEVFIPRWGEVIQPFAGWDTGKLPWWDSYVEIKHNRGDSFQRATYQSAVFALSALYVLILYLAKINNTRVEAGISRYITSAYAFRFFVSSPLRQLPDFEDTNTAPITGGLTETAKVFTQVNEPKEAREGDIWIKSEGL